MEAGTGTRPIAETLVAALGAICGTAQVISDPGTLAVYAADAQRRASQLPALAVLPGSSAEVAAVVRACTEHATPWVTRGAGTGLSGGAVPVEAGVLIVLSRLTRILEVDLGDARVVVEPGVSAQAISRAVAPTHFYAPDPAGERVSTLGGQVAENAGGPHGLKYGATGHSVTGLDVVLADGTLVQLRRDSPGYDLVGAFVGSEGTLGVAVAIHLRVLPVPESRRSLVAFFDSTVQAGDAASRIVAAGLAPAALEVIDTLAASAGAAAADAVLRADAGAALLVDLDGPRETTAGSLETIAAQCGRAGARDLRVALDADERAALWSACRVLYAAMRRVSSAYEVGDGVVPRSRLAETLQRIAALASEFSLPVANLIHAGEGTLHPIVCWDASSPEQADRARELSGRILDVCLDAGGSIAGEHGIGVDKRERMRRMYTEADLGAFDRLRRAFDPATVANPGKLLPESRA